MTQRPDATQTIAIRAWCDGCVLWRRGLPSNGLIAGPDQLARVIMPIDRTIRIHRAPVGWLPINPRQLLCPHCSLPLLLLAITLC